MTTELGSLSNRFAATSEEMRQQASRAAADIAAEQARLRSEVERLPVTAHESSEGMRRALHDQIKALDQLSQLAARSAVQRDVIQPSPPLQSETMAPNPQPRPREQARSLTSLSSTIAQELGNRQRQRGPAPDNREGWSLGDLLARASRDEEGHGHPNAAAPAQQRPPQTAFNLDLEAIARALDPATAAAIWQRLRSGQRGVMVRSIYGNEGRAVFDDLSHRCRNDGELSRTVGRYLADFERIVSESERAIRAAACRTASSSPTPAASICSSPTLPAVSAERHGAARGSPAHRSHGRGMAARQAVRHRARRQDRGACRRGARRRRRLRGPRRSRPLRALRRDRRGRAACAARTARSARAANACPICCRPARRATRSIARCGTSRPSPRANAPGISPACRRRSRR